MDINEYISNFEAFQTELNETFLEFAATQALNAKALAQNRVQSLGIGEDESAIAYTSEEMDGAYSSGYAKKRKKRGRQIGYVDLTFTRGGAGMYGSSGIILQTFEGGTAFVSIGGRDSFSQDKLNWNSERYKKNVLGVTEKEQEAITGEFNNYIGALIQKHGL